MCIVHANDTFPVVIIHDYNQKNIISSTDFSLSMSLSNVIHLKFLNYSKYELILNKCFLRVIIETALPFGRNFYNSCLMELILAR